MEAQSVTKSVELLVDGRVATICLNRPEVLNALHRPMLKELCIVLKDVADREDVDIVILKGAGRGFCAGGDIKSMLLTEEPSSFHSIMDTISELVITLYSLPKVTLSAIHGPAAGLGFSLALATDYILTTDDATLAMNFIGIGLIPDGGAHFFLERKIGEHKAKHVIWDGKKLSAQEALHQGLIDEVSSLSLDEAILGLVEQWLKKPTQAMIKTKKILAEANRPRLLKILELEKHGQTKMRETEDHLEGIHAFIEKRQPHYKGK